MKSDENPKPCPFWLDDDDPAPAGTCAFCVKYAGTEGAGFCSAKPKPMPDPFQQLLTALPTYPGMKQVSVYDLPVPKLPHPKPKRRKR